MNNHLLGGSTWLQSRCFEAGLGAVLHIAASVALAQWQLSSGNLHSAAQFMFKHRFTSTKVSAGLLDHDSCGPTSLLELGRLIVGILLSLDDFSSPFPHLIRE